MVPELWGDQRRGADTSWGKPGSPVLFWVCSECCGCRGQCPPCWGKGPGAALHVWPAGTGAESAAPRPLDADLNKGTSESARASVCVLSGRRPPSRGSGSDGSGGVARALPGLVTAESRLWDERTGLHLRPSPESPGVQEARPQLLAGPQSVDGALGLGSRPGTEAPWCPGHGLGFPAGAAGQRWTGTRAPPFSRGVLAGAGPSGDGPRGRVGAARHSWCGAHGRLALRG